MERTLWASSGMVKKFNGLSHSFCDGGPSVRAQSKAGLILKMPVMFDSRTQPCETGPSSKAHSEMFIAFGQP